MSLEASNNSIHYISPFKKHSLFDFNYIYNIDKRIYFAQNGGCIR